MSVFHNQLKSSIVWRGFYFVTLLLINIFLSRFLKADGTGLIYYLVNFFSFLVLILSFNMDGSFTYFSASKMIRPQQLAIVALLWTCIVGMVVYWLLPLYFKHFDTGLANANENLSTYGFYYVTGFLLSNYFTALFYSVGNFLVPNIVLGIGNILLICLIFFATKTAAPANAIINDYFYFMLLQGIVLALVFIAKNNSLQHYKFPSKQDMKQLVHYSAIGLAGNFIFFFVYRIDYWFVKNWCTQLGDLGNYIQASKLSQMMLIAPQILASSIFPQMASGLQQEQVVSAIARLFRIFLLVYIIIFLGVVSCGKWLFPWVFGSSFTTMYIPMLILIPGIFCLSISTLLSAYFSGKKQNKYNVFAAIFALAIMIVLTILLKHQYSIYIAAAISSIAYCCESLFCFIKFSQQEKIQLRQFFLFTTDDFKWFKKLFI